MAQNKKANFDPYIVADVEISDNAVQSYAVNDDSVSPDGLPVAKKSNSQRITDEFIMNFRAAQTARAPYERKWNEANTFLWGSNPRALSEKEKNAGSPGETTQNLLWPIFQYKLAELTQNGDIEINITKSSMPGGKLFEALTQITKDAEAEELHQEDIQDLYEQAYEVMYATYAQTVSDLSKVVKATWQSVGKQELLKRLYQDALSTGTSFLELTMNEKSEGVPVEGVHLPVYDAFLDPGATNFQASRFFIVSQTTSLLSLLENKQLKGKLTPEVIKSIRQSAVGQQDPAVNMHFEDDRQSSPTGGNNQTIGYHRYFKKYLDSEGNAHIGCYYFAGNFNRPVLIYAVNDIQADFYPFVPLFFNKRTEMLYGKSFLDLLIPTQKLYNKYEALIKLQLIQSARPHYFLSRLSGIKPSSFDTTLLTPGVVHQTKLDQPANAVHVVQVNPIPGELVNFLDKLEANLNKIAGVNDMQLGNNKVTGTGSGAVSATLAQAQLPERLNALDITTFISDAVAVMVDMLSRDTQNLRVVAYRENNPSLAHQQQSVIYTGSDYQNLSFDLNVDVKLYTAAERQQIEQKMLQMYTLSQQYPGLASVVSEEELIQSMELFPNKTDALQRIRAAKDQNKMQVAQGIIQLIGQNMANAVAAQGQQQYNAAAMADGATEEEIAASGQQAPAVIDPNQLLQMVADMIDQTPFNIAQQQSQAQMQSGGEPAGGNNQLSTNAAARGGAN